MRNIILAPLLFLFSLSGVAHAQARLAVSLLSFSGGELEHDDSGQDFDFSGSSFAYGSGLSLGYRFAGDFEAGLSLAFQSTELGESESSLDIVGVYGTYYFAGSSAQQEKGLSWFVKATAATGSSDNGAVESDLSSFGVFGGPELKLSDEVSLSAQAGYTHQTLEIADVEIAGGVFGGGLFLHVTLPVSFDTNAKKKN